MSESDLDKVSWPRARLGEAMRALALRSGIEVRGEPPPAPEENVDLWLDAAARSLGLEAVRVEIPRSELDDFLRSRGPSLVRVGEGRFLAVRRGGRRRIVVLTEGGIEKAIARDVVRSWLVPSSDGELDRLLAPTALSAGRRERVRRALAEEEQRDLDFGDAWLLRPEPGASLRAAVAQSRLMRHFAVFASAYAADYSLFVLSWWLVGKGALDGQVDTGWLVAWALLFATMLPFRAISTWHEGKVAVAAGGLLKTRLLLGAMRLGTDELRVDGAGRHLSRVFESEAVEHLALDGGLLSSGATVELLVAVVVLALGAGGLPHAALLIGFLVVLALVAARYYRERKRWTDERLAMSHDVVERMVGHRTRLAQQPKRLWHEGEDAALASYMARSRRVDGRNAWLWGLPRFWLPIGLLGIALPFLQGTATVGSLAVALGGMILAARGLEKLSFGWTAAVDAVIAWQRIAPTFRAAERLPTPGDPALASAASPTGSNGGVLLEASDVAFRYPSRPEPVLRGVRFSLKRGDRILLTSPSGGGKSTLVSLVNGLREPVSGMLLLDGVDRGSLGHERWSRLVATAPQFHENHVFTESFAFNLLMGRRWPPSLEDWDEAEALCRELGLGPLLDKMPGGMNQLVGDTGWQLSHGERSRLFLARALLQGGELTLLDESFAALDPENLRQALTCARERTKSLLVVAHV